MKFSSVSFFNDNRVSIKDISDEQLKNSNLIVCLDPCDIKDESNFIRNIFEKVNDYLLIEMVDVPLTENEFKYIYKKETTIDANKAMGYTCEYSILPSKKHIDSMYDFIERHFGEDFIVACSAGVSRSGALAHYLIARGYELNDLSNTTFIPNTLVLNELLLKSGITITCNNTVDIVSEGIEELILNINGKEYIYHTTNEDDYIGYFSRRIDENYFVGTIVLGDIYIFNGCGLKLNKKSRL